MHWTALAQPLRRACATSPSGTSSSKRPPRRKTIRDCNVCFGAPMSAPTTAAAPAIPPPGSAPVATPPRRLLRLLWLVGVVVLAGLAIFVAYPWWSYRQTHSITEDAFVEAHIINVAPQTVSGHIVCFLVEENDRVKKGDFLVHLDRETYQVQVEIKRAAVLVAEKNLAATI